MTHRASENVKRITHNLAGGIEALWIVAQLSLPVKEADDWPTLPNFPEEHRDGPMMIELPVDIPASVRRIVHDLGGADKTRTQGSQRHARPKGSSS